ncbi:DUF1737 domain-containing protein [Paracoccus aestuarii]|uniref:DUF1737 domain-containing protein n=1 Tax=Paracoccus aestuarii TaxID=453842 RepID=A0A418ZZP1_9RHOB|nr:DUF1737 domain-containing protein [Paracoccus aestuarii]RJL05948.1 DUF1737 domain-containing protein [Paracoccus aestuarii]WCR00755.1 DUF1737 domain-containing protein [Paracoccus aestuarii]
MGLIYRCITEDDTSRFCHRVSEALSNGWSLHGNPAMAHDPATGVMRMAQAVTKHIPDDYHPDMKLGQQ